MAYIFAADSMGLSSFNFFVVGSERRIFSGTECVSAVQGHPRSLILAPIERAYATSYYWLIVTLVLSCTVSEIRWVISWKLWIFPTPPLFDRPFWGNPFEFLDETYRAKTRRMGLLFIENFMILASAVFDWSTRVTDRRTDRQTDRQMDGWNCRSIYALPAMLSRIKMKAALFHLLTELRCSSSN